MKKIFFRLFLGSFRAQLIYGIGFFIALMLFIFIYMGTTDNNDLSRARAKTSAFEHSLALASMAKVWVMSNDYVGLEEALENFSIYNDLLFAAVIDADGRIIAHTDKKLLGTYVADERRIRFLKKTHADKKHNVEIIQNERVIDVLQIIHNEEAHIGFVHLRFDQRAREEQIGDRTNASIAFGALYLALVVFLLYLIVGVFTRQLEALLVTMKKVRDGDKEIKANEGGYNELSQLSHEFNDMLESIASGVSELKSVKERLEYAVNGTRDGLWDWKVGTDYIYFSPRFKEMLGYEDSEFPNSLKSWETIIHPEDRAQVEEAIDLSNEKPNVFYETTHRVKKKDGTIAWVLDRAQTIFNEEGKAVRMVGFYTDVTKQKELEQELLDQEELIIAQSRQAAMGEMIGMIAHQWRQPISVIAMGANNILVDVALEQGTEEGFVKEAELILNQTQHLSKTIDDFRNFFRPNKEKNETNVCDVILEAKKIIGVSLQNHNVELLISDAIEETILTYSRELLQVILNLLKNAAEALESNKTKNAFIKVEVQSVGDFITISVCDNGGGMDKAVIGRVFEPYFSTKDAKNGTGLGLYMSKTIIQKHLHGAIAATNKDEGACFTIKLPKVFNA